MAPDDPLPSVADAFKPKEGVFSAVFGPKRDGAPAVAWAPNNEVG